MQDSEKTINGEVIKSPFEDKIFEKIDYTVNRLTKGSYEKCSFVNCRFSATDVQGINFTDCTFKSCDLSTAKINKSAFKGVKFRDSKLLGVHFESINDFFFSVDFENCILNMSSFYKLTMKKTQFKKCSLQEVDFAECNLSGAMFSDCDFTRAKFDRTVLEKADLSTSFNYSIDPERNKIKKAKFSLYGIAGLLDKYEIEIE